MKHQFSCLMVKDIFRFGTERSLTRSSYFFNQYLYREHRGRFDHHDELNKEIVTTYDNELASVHNHKHTFGIGRYLYSIKNTTIELAEGTFLIVR